MFAHLTPCSLQSPSVNAIQISDIEALEMQADYLERALKLDEELSRLETLKQLAQNSSDLPSLITLCDVNSELSTLLQTDARSLTKTQLVSALESYGSDSDYRDRAMERRESFKRGMKLAVGLAAGAGAAALAAKTIYDKKDNRSKLLDKASVENAKSAHHAGELHHMLKSIKSGDVRGAGRKFYGKPQKPEQSYKPVDQRLRDEHAASTHNLKTTQDTHSEIMEHLKTLKEKNPSSLTTRALINKADKLHDKASVHGFRATAKVAQSASKSVRPDRKSKGSSL